MSDKLIPQEAWEVMNETERTIMAVANQIADEAIVLARKKDATPFMRLTAYNMRKAAIAVMVDGKDVNPVMWERSMFLMLLGAYLVGARGKPPADMDKILSKLSEAGLPGGLARGEQASAEAEKKWRALAREKAIKIKHDNPKFNQKQVIKEIFETWPAGIEPPPEDSLRKNVIRPIFQEKAAREKS